ncbi:MAG: HlyD family efflux transporter periplasmic adaptor subunit, partial [Saprospiraceae bacterium]|nr:HlyD family efflux transporter periplasmic adaptor subunit [Saprospiraceae bacterium]
IATINQVLIKKGDLVEESQPIMVFNSKSSFEDMLKLETIVKENKLNQRNLQQLKLGELNDKIKSFLINESRPIDQPKPIKKESKSDDNQRLTLLLDQQKKLNESLKDLNITKQSTSEWYKKQQQDYSEGKISLSALQNARNKLTEVEKSIQNTESELNKINVELSSLQKEVKKIDKVIKHNIPEKKQINNENNSTKILEIINNWKAQHLILAQKSGVVDQVYVSENQQIYKDDKLYAIANNLSNDSIAYCNIPNSLIGKMTSGEEFQILIDNKSIEGVVAKLLDVETSANTQKPTVRFAIVQKTAKDPFSINKKSTAMVLIPQQQNSLLTYFYERLKLISN